MTIVTFFRSALGFFALLPGLGCGDTSGPGPAPGPITPAPVSSIQIGSLPQRIEIGDKLKLTAVALDSKGNVLTGRQISWSVSDSEVASATDDGTVVFRRRGPVTFTATSEAKTASVTVTVNPITWVSLSLAFWRSCGVSLAGALYCWGDSWPAANIPSSNRPLPVPATTHMKLKEVLVGSYHICVLDIDDKVFCWGGNPYGELSFAGNTNLSTPTLVPTQLTFKAFAQSTDAAHTCAQTPSNQIACWGRRPGQNVVATPTLIANGEPLRAHATNGEEECFLKQDARVYCWGLTGAVGFEPGVFRETPTPLAFSEPVVDVSNHCLLAQSGQPWCWTHNVGQGEYSPFLVYSSVALVSFAKGGTDLCALTSDGTPYCRSWSLGGTESFSFVRVGDLRFRSLSASLTHACGTAVDGALYCWGSNQRGELGNGTFVTSRIPLGVRDPIIP